MVQSIQFFDQIATFVLLSGKTPLFSNILAIYNCMDIQPFGETIVIGHNYGDLHKCIYIELKILAHSAVQKKDKWRNELE